jgi:hypothetical protein
MLYFLLAAVLAALPGTPASTELAQVFAAGTATGATMAISPIRASSTCSTSGRAGACRRPISRWRGKTTIYVTWRDKRGEQADVVPINFDPTAALAEEQKKLLEQFWTSLIAFREWQGMTVYFTHVVTYRCAIKEVGYGFGDGPVDKVFNSALRRRRPAQRAREGHALHEGAAKDRVDAGAAHRCGRHDVAGTELQRAYIGGKSRRLRQHVGFKPRESCLYGGHPTTIERR